LLRKQSILGAAVDLKGEAMTTDIPTTLATEINAEHQAALGAVNVAGVGKQ
jgi:hypothetical protein